MDSEGFKNFRISLNLSRFVSDYRSLALLYITKKVPTIQALIEKISHYYQVPISKFYLTCENKYLPPEEDIRVLEKDDSIWVLPMPEDLQIPAEPEASKPTERENTNGDLEITSLKKKSKKKQKEQTVNFEEIEDATPVCVVGKEKKQRKRPREQNESDDAEDIKKHSTKKKKKDKTEKPNQVQEEIINDDVQIEENKTGDLKKKKHKKINKKKERNNGYVQLDKSSGSEDDINAYVLNVKSERKKISENRSFVSVNSKSANDFVPTVHSSLSSLLSESQLNSYQSLTENNETSPKSASIFDNLGCDERDDTSNKQKSSYDTSTPLNKDTTKTETKPHNEAIKILSDIVLSPRRNSTKNNINPPDSAHTEAPNKSNCSPNNEEKQTVNNSSTSKQLSHHKKFALSNILEYLRSEPSLSDEASSKPKRKRKRVRKKKKTNSDVVSSAVHLPPLPSGSKPAHAKPAFHIVFSNEESSEDDSYDKQEISDSLNDTKRTECEVIDKLEEEKVTPRSEHSSEETVRMDFCCNQGNAEELTKEKIDVGEFLNQRERSNQTMDYSFAEEKMVTSNSSVGEKVTSRTKHDVVENVKMETCNCADSEELTKERSTGVTDLLENTKIKDDETSNQQMDVSFTKKKNATSNSSVGIECKSLAFVGEDVEMKTATYSNCKMKNLNSSGFNSSCNSSGSNRNLSGSSEKPIYCCQHKGVDLTMVEGAPTIQDIILFKVLRLTEDYTPTVSSTIIGKVLDFDVGSQMVSLKIIHGNDQLKFPDGKFHVSDNEDDLQIGDKKDEGIVEFRWSELIEPKHCSLCV